MLKISAEQMKLFDRDYFFQKLERFISVNCRNDKLLVMLADERRLRALWTPVWDRASKLSEHDCAVLLVLLAVCECEGVAVAAVEALAGQMREREVQIKLFISDRGYLRFSDFDYPSGRAEGEAHA